ncbi:unnamed protein product [Timema podura]|uniref:Conserved oligomeric Golgi complex subunit 5 N-terminal domain-containing protein n=1 Tax=Timema podura TaxID=61482 RepID=A0ABN7NQZ9_TIMPD|nr:unnamed protein product [Timema podura]
MEEYDVFRVIANDEFFQQFLDKERCPDVKPNVVLSVAEQIKKLSEVITLMDKELQKQVLSNHEGLLSQATWVEKLEEVLAVMQTHVQSLLSAVERLRTKIVEPFSKIETQTVMLSRLHATSDLLRRVARIQHLVKRLNSQMKLADINKAAQSLSELDRNGYKDIMGSHEVGPRSKEGDMGSNGVGPRSKEGNKGSHGVGPRKRKETREVMETKEKEGNKGSHGVGPRSKEGDKGSNEVGPRSKEEDKGSNEVGPRSKEGNKGSHGVGPRSKEGDKGSHGVGPRNKEGEDMVNLCLRNIME